MAMEKTKTKKVSLYFFPCLMKILRVFAELYFILEKFPLLYHKKQNLPTESGDFFTEYLEAFDIFFRL